MDVLLEKQFSVPANDLDHRGKIKIEALLGFLMESAAAHAAALGVSVFDLGRKNLTWVLSRYHVRLLRYPLFGETVTVRTWPASRKGVFTLRDFEVEGSGGPVARATTSWLAVDLDNRKPVDLEARLGDFPLRTVRALPDEFDPLPRPEKADLIREYPVLKSHLDFNRHVNNSVYIQWAIETVPREILFSMSPAEIEINYRGEVFYGDRIRVTTERVEEAPEATFLHRVLRVRNGGESEAATLRTTWSRT